MHAARLIPHQRSARRTPLSSRLTEHCRYAKGVVDSVMAQDKQTYPAATVVSRYHCTTAWTRDHDLFRAEGGTSAHKSGGE